MRNDGGKPSENRRFRIFSFLLLQNIVKKGKYARKTAKKMHYGKDNLAIFFFLCYAYIIYSFQGWGWMENKQGGNRL